MSCGRSSKLAIVYLGDQWDEGWRRRQQIASRLAESPLVDRLLYVEQPLTVTSLAKLALRSADGDATRRWRRLFTLRSPICEISPKLSVLTPLTATPSTRYQTLNDSAVLTAYCSTALLAKRVLRDQDQSRTLLWVSIPYISERTLDRYRRPWLWYDCTEDFSAFDHLPVAVRRAFRRADEALTQEADVVSVVSHAQFLDKSRVRGEVHWIPNAVDVSLFGGSRANRPPKDLESIPRPRLVHIGAVNEYLDWDLVQGISRAHPEWSVVLVGPVALSPRTRRLLGKLANVHLLGLKPYRALPTYLAHCDVCIQFYVADRSPSYESSQKMHLYLASGKPVVSYSLGSSVEVSQLVATAASASEFIAQVSRSLLMDTPSEARRRMEFARRNSWNARLRTIESCLEHLTQGNYSA